MRQHRRKFELVTVTGLKPMAENEPKRILLKHRDIILKAIRAAFPKEGLHYGVIPGRAANRTVR
jgi:hypothetical protein